jgi:hypothetical protein
MSAWLLGLAALAACGDDDNSGPDAQLVNGCPSLTAPQASPGDPIDGDNLAGFALPLFEQFCTRCHASTLSGDDRNGAPVGFDWDVEASIRAELPRIRNAVGVFNFMPLNPPLLSCEQRQRLVRWIDAGAP